MLGSLFQHTTLSLYDGSHLFCDIHRRWEVPESQARGLMHNMVTFFARNRPF